MSVFFFCIFPCDARYPHHRQFKHKIIWNICKNKKQNTPGNCAGDLWNFITEFGIFWKYYVFFIKGLKIFIELNFWMNVANSFQSSLFSRCNSLLWESLENHWIRLKRFSFSAVSTVMQSTYCWVNSISNVPFLQVELSENQ